jgi:hypothetical protein
MLESAPGAISIIDPENPYRYIQIRGRVGRVTEEGASAHIDFLAKKYSGKDSILGGNLVMSGSLLK